MARNPRTLITQPKILASKSFTRTPNPERYTQKHALHISLQQHVSMISKCRESNRIYHIKRIEKNNRHNIYPAYSHGTYEVESSIFPSPSASVVILPKMISTYKLNINIICLSFPDLLFLLK